MTQIVIISKEESVINQYLSDGWVIVSVTAQVVASHQYGSIDSTRGSFLIVLEKA